MNWKIALLIAIAIFVIRDLFHFETFHSGTLSNCKNYWWSSFGGLFGGLFGDKNIEFTTDPLPNLYRKWHNIENVNRNEVLEHQHVQNAGGDHMINRQWLIAEKLDREAATIQRQINNHIESNRIPWSDANNLSSPINFPYDTYDIIGIPSVPGTLHAYY